MKYLLIISLLLVSCSPSKRINRLLTRFPGAMVSDTVYSLDTIITPLNRLDTILYVHEPDTVVIEKEGIRTQYIIKDSVIYTSVECLPDTIIREVVRTVNMRPAIRPKTNWGMWLIIGAVVLLVVRWAVGFFDIKM